MDFVQRTIELARMNVEAGGRPFSCVIVKDEAVLAEEVNLVAQTHDPTAHAEICAIREATAKLQTEHLMGCEFYILAHPCPMCLAAMYYTREEYGAFYQDDRKYISFASFYNEFGQPWYQRRLPIRQCIDAPPALPLDRADA
jgi:guanine deaminase